MIGKNEPGLPTKSEYADAPKSIIRVPTVPVTKNIGIDTLLTYV